MVCPKHIPSNLLKAVFEKFYLVHSWILCPNFNNFVMYKFSSNFFASQSFKHWLAIKKKIAK